MAQQTIGIGTVANDGTGDPLRTAFDKVNTNFAELYARPSGRTLISSTTISGTAATIDFTGIASGYSKLVLEINGLSHSSGSADYRLQFGVSGPTYRTASYTYQIVDTGLVSSGNSGMTFGSPTASTDKTNGLIEICAYDSASQFTIARVSAITLQSTGSIVSSFTLVGTCQGGGAPEANDSFRLIPSASTFSAGTVKLYGVP